MKLHIDPQALTLADIMKNLNSADPSRFRDAMSDVGFTGSDPSWYEQALMEKLNMIPSENPINPNDEKSLRHHKEWLIEDKGKIVTELSRI